MGNKQGKKEKTEKEKVEEKVPEKEKVTETSVDEEEEGEDYGYTEEEKKVVGNKDGEESLNQKTEKLTPNKDSTTEDVYQDGRPQSTSSDRTEEVIIQEKGQEVIQEMEKEKGQENSELIVSTTTETEQEMDDEELMIQMRQKEGNLLARSKLKERFREKVMTELKKIRKIEKVSETIVNTETKTSTTYCIIEVADVFKKLTISHQSNLSVEVKKLNSRTPNKILVYRNHELEPFLLIVFHVLDNNQLSLDEFYRERARKVEKDGGRVKNMKESEFKMTHLLDKARKYEFQLFFNIVFKNMFLVLTLSNGFKVMFQHMYDKMDDEKMKNVLNILKSFKIENLD